LRAGRTIHAVIATILVCLALGVAACGGGGGGGGGGGSSSSGNPQQQPVAQTGLHGNVEENEAEVSATVNPKNQSSVTYYFEYGESTEYGEQTPSKPVSGNKNETVTADLSELDADTTYHYRVVVKLGSGTMVTGRDRTFTTAAAGEGGGASDAEGGTTGGGTTTRGGTTGKSTGGYTTTPPPSTGGYTTTPPPSTGGYTTTPPPSTGGYTTTPPPSTGGYTTTPPDK
jgi:hypothetical protein